MNEQLSPRKNNLENIVKSLMFFDKKIFIFHQCLTALSDLKATSLKIQLLVPGLFFAELHAGNCFRLT
jgi:hypothetical protein